MSEEVEVEVEVEAKKAKKEPAERKQRAPGVGTLVVEALLAGKPTAEILEAIAEAFPGSKASASTISWYRTKLKKDGKL